MSDTDLRPVPRYHHHHTTLLADAFVKAADTLTPLKLFDEGLMEANLRTVEKANWKLRSRRLTDIDAAMKLAKIYAQ
jgi:hypothetical protein